MKTGAIKKKLGLYLHIPFCVKKCLYCDFCSYTSNESDIVSGYVDRLCSDIEQFSASCGNYAVDTVYFGGGTPTLLPINEFKRITESIKSHFCVLDDAEISCECNPATAGFEYFRALRKLGINRLSIGLQSVHDEELIALGRIHKYSDFLRTYNDARDAGFDNISVDLMYGIPHQTLDSFAKSIETLCALSPQHISAYGLKIEDATPFGKMRESLPFPNEDSEYDMYMLVTERLSKYGYNKYEISNFSLCGCESRHNIKYWMGDDYVGFGVAAHSYFDGKRFANSRDIKSYIKGKDIIEYERAIPLSEQMTEFVMLRMRLSQGVEHKMFFDSFGESFLERYGKALEPYVQGGFVISDEKNTFFSSKGFFVSNYILSDILDFD